MSDPQTAEMLANCSLFEKLSDKELKKVQDEGMLCTFKAEEVIFERNDEGNEFYAILEGLVQITVPDPLSERNKTLALLGPEEILGEMSILTEKERSAKATAARKSTLYEIKKKSFLDLLHEIPQIGVNLSRILCRRLWDTDAEVQTVTFKTLQGRIASQLIKLGKHFGRDVDGGVKIDFNMTHKKLADIVGTHRESVSRNVKELEKKDIIDFDDDKIIIKNMERLESMM